MLVLMAPSFAGRDADYQRLSAVTGMVVYDLRARLKPGGWGLVKALADEVEAQRLATSLRSEGFSVVVVPREVATDPGRPIVALRGLLVEGNDLTLELAERTMRVPAPALCCIVRAEAQVGKGALRGAGLGATSSATFRAVVPDASDVQVFRESMPPASFEAFAAADLHFHSVSWVARIDARSFDFRVLGIAAASPANALDTLVDRLSLLAKVRVDRGARSSSVASFTQQAGRGITPHPHPGGPSSPMAQRAREIAGDERFDPYSRVIGEAERLLSAERAAQPPVA